MSSNFSSWLVENYNLVLGVTPVTIGAILLLASCFTIIRNQMNYALLGAIFVGAALCGSAVFSSISWSKDTGKIETIAGALAASRSAVSENKVAINELKDALVNLKAQVDEIAAAMPRDSGAGTPTSPPGKINWEKIQNDLKNFDSKIGNVNDAIKSSGGQIETLNKSLQELKIGRDIPRF